MGFVRLLKVILLVLILAFPAWSEDASSTGSRGKSSLSRLGFQFERFKGGTTDSGTQGFMLGLRSLSYLWRTNFYYGYELNVGSPSDSSIRHNNLFYTGLSFGMDYNLSSTLNLDLSGLVGYGFGANADIGSSGDSVVVQPSIGLGFILVGGYRVIFAPGYFYFPGTKGFNGISFTLRFERKVETSPSKGVDF
jgi:hypothetical protein